MAAPLVTCFCTHCGPLPWSALDCTVSETVTRSMLEYHPPSDMWSARRHTTLYCSRQIWCLCWPIQIHSWTNSNEFKWLIPWQVIVVSSYVVTQVLRDDPCKNTSVTHTVSVLYLVKVLVFWWHTVWLAFRQIKSPFTWSPIEKSGLVKIYCRSFVTFLWVVTQQVSLHVTV